MLVPAEIRMFKSSVVNDTNGSNGGRLSTLSANEVISNVVQNVWPHVFSSERTSGSLKYRKVSVHIMNDADAVLYSPMFYLDMPTDGDDWVTMHAGTYTDTQDSSETATKFGAGYLQSNASSGTSTVVVLVPDELASGSHAIFRNDGKIRITNKLTPDAVSGTEEIHTITSSGVSVGTPDGGTPVSYTPVTLTLVGTLVNNYNTVDLSRVSSLYEPGNIKAELSGSVTETNYHSGTFDESLITFDHIETIYQTVTLTFTGSGSFTAASDAPGVSLPSGTTGSDYAPTGPNGKPYFTVPSTAWTGTWTADGGGTDSVVIPMKPAAVALWGRRKVPAGAASVVNNKVVQVIVGEAVS